jgi:tetratricopeptide (TPR) repeat protein
MRGDWEAARSYGRQAIATAHEANDVIHEFIGHLMLGLPLARLGDVDGGAAVLERAIEIARRAETVLLLGRAYGWLAEVELLRDRPAAALRAAEAGFELARTHGYLFDRALCERALGSALLELEDGRRAEAAQAHLRDALAQFQVIGAQPEVARTRLALARCATRRGLPAVARAEAAEAAGLFRTLGMASEGASLDV